MSRHSLPQVLTVTLNPAVDHTIELDGLTLGEVNRARSMQADVGGKGINVASCLADFGVACMVSGQLGRDNAALFETLFDAKGISNRFHYLDGLTRINTKLVDRHAGTTTDINMPGPSFDDLGANALLTHIETLLDTTPSCRWVVLAGSLPPGLPADTYARLTDWAHRRGASVLLDASGAALAAGVAAAPDIVKPNRAELSELLGAVLSTREDIVAGARGLIGRPQGPRQVIVSLGADGALFVTASQALLAQPLALTPLSTVGAGDAMVAGIVAATLEAQPLVEVARLASAFSAAKLARIGPHLPEAESVRNLARDIVVTALH